MIFDAVFSVGGLGVDDVVVTVNVPVWASLQPLLLRVIAPLTAPLGTVAVIVRVFSPKDYAEAGTSERWYLPMRRTDESQVQDKNVYYGVYDIDYSLRKINGAWLIDEASTPRSQK